MSVLPAPLSRTVIVARLRAAGCVFAEDEAQLLISSARTPADLAILVDRRVAGLPLEHVLGWAEFCGLRVAVEPGVFVPRRRTEFLAEQASGLAHQIATTTGPHDAQRRPVVVDLCCGSGAVGVALTAVLGIDLHAVDIDPASAHCARRNIGAAGRVYEGDLYAPLPAELRGRVDILVANAPYVPTEAIELLPPEARIHEPRIALDGGTDGHAVQRRVAAAAPLWLAPDGHLLVETSTRQAAQTAKIFTGVGLSTQVVSSAEHDATVVIGTKPQLVRRVTAGSRSSVRGWSPAGSSQ
ncbi:putative protein N(5)-glutamine methyltransferase [Micromonospora polyrhachis]|uniref:peptide chain release factor N(5)-glutamine methyltransferase n=1 Tax=Micromonospora polyrhachis TaxID=1282883 RepID=A0A7W7SW33_9ACTN|nr:putative protein N(5)-glutamine methyltransferase [Micromonospora polyrhachis]MBB4962001.1 release factor glutamine methyltransferase [Micromonospora polyrhachis]